MTGGKRENFTESQKPAPKKQRLSTVPESQASKQKSRIHVLHRRFHSETGYVWLKNGEQSGRFRCLSGNQLTNHLSDFFLAAEVIPL